MIVELISQDPKIKYIHISFGLSSLKLVLCRYTMQTDPSHASFPQRTQLFWKFKMGALFCLTLASGCNSRLLNQSSILVYLEFWLIWRKYRTIDNIYQHTGNECNQSSLLTSRKRTVYYRFQVSPSLRFVFVLCISITWNIFMLTSQFLPGEIVMHKC